MPQSPRKKVTGPKRTSVTQELEVPSFTPDDQEVQVVTSVLQKFRETANLRNQSLQLFDGASLIEYIEDSVNSFTTNVFERDDIEDWQARMHEPFTRNKVLAILGKIVQVLPIAQMEPRGADDPRRASLLTGLYEYSEEVDDYDDFMINYILEAIVKGTAIGFEGVVRKDVVRRDVKKFGDKLTYTKKDETTTALSAVIVPLEDFYPQTLYMSNIKKMSFCFWRTRISYSDFISNWGMYKKAEFVQEHATGTFPDQSRPFYQDFISADVQDGEVEIVRYFNKDTDEFIIIANGVWLNPVEVSITNQETGEDALENIISPLPWNHKQLPFFDVKYDIFITDFFYGKSLPDRLKVMQLVLDTLNNMLLDQSFLTIFPPLLTNGTDLIEDDYLRPGRRTPVDTQGASLNESFLKLDLGTPTGWHQYILEYTRKIAEQSSLDQVSSGSAGVGGRTTAEEIKLAAGGVASMLGLFARLLNTSIKKKAMLRTSNIMQFWTDPETPVVTSVLGDGGNAEFNKAFRTFTVDNTILTSGKRGVKIIELYQDKKDMPTEEQLQARSMVKKAASNKQVELIAVSPEYIRGTLADVKLVPNPKSEASREIAQAMQLEKVRVYLSFFPEMVDKQELAIQTAEKMGDDPTKVLKSELFNPPQPAAAGQQNPEAAQPISQNPEGNLANNAIRGMMGGEGQSMQLRDLQNQMTQ